MTRNSGGTRMSLRTKTIRVLLGVTVLFAAVTGATGTTATGTSATVVMSRTASSMIDGQHQQQQHQHKKQQQQQQQQQQDQQQQQRLRPLNGRRLIDALGRHEDGVVEEQAEGRLEPAPTPNPTLKPTPAPMMLEDPFAMEQAIGRHTDDDLEQDEDNPILQEVVNPNRHEDDPNEINVIVEPMTDSPTMAPTISAAPTVSKAPSLSDPPSMVPSAMPSFMPSQIPTGLTLQAAEPSSVPTMSDMPSAAPSVDCTSDAATGMFGVESSNSTEVAYTFEIEVTEQANIANILSMLEIAISDSVLPVLFVDQCADFVAPSGGRKLMTIMSSGSGMRQRRRLEIVGISLRPEDSVTQQECSVALSAASNVCNVVDGGFTLFFNGPENGERDAALAAIKEKMNNGDYNSVDPGIVRLTFVDRPVDPGTGGPETTPPQPEGRNRRSGFPVWAYILIVIGVLFVLGLAIFAYRRRRNRDQYDDDESIRGDSAVEQEDYQPPDTISALTPP